MGNIITYLPRIAKAIFAGVSTAIAEYGLAELVSSPGQEVVTIGEWGFIIATALAVGWGTYKVKNAGTSTPPAPG